MTDSEAVKALAIALHAGCVMNSTQHGVDAHTERAVGVLEHLERADWRLVYGRPSVTSRLVSHGKIVVADATRGMTRGE